MRHTPIRVRSRDLPRRARHGRRGAGPAGHRARAAGGRGHGRGRAGSRDGHQRGRHPHGGEERDRLGRDRRRRIHRHGLRHARGRLPAGSAPPGPGPASICVVSSAIEPGASLTAVFAGSSRRPLQLQARARAVAWDTGLQDVDTKPLTISGPALPEPAAPRVSRLTIEDPRLRPGARALLRFRLDRAAKDPLRGPLQMSRQDGLPASGARREQHDHEAWAERGQHPALPVARRPGSRPLPHHRVGV